MNWLLGTPTTVKPRLRYSSCRASSWAYCGVSPHRLATLTTRAGPPRVSARRVVSPPWGVVGGGWRRSLMPGAAAGGSGSSRTPAPSPLLPPAPAVPVLLDTPLTRPDAERRQLG